MVIKSPYRFIRLLIIRSYRLLFSSQVGHIYIWLGLNPRALASAELMGCGLSPLPRHMVANPVTGLGLLRVAVYRKQPAL